MYLGKNVLLSLPKQNGDGETGTGIFLRATDDF
jgi:hypothetical protein